MELNLLVIYVRDIIESRDFYTELGLSFVREQHGKGPEHYAAVVGTTVFELYPAAGNNITEVVAVLRLGFTVNSLSKTFSRLEKSDRKVVSKARETVWGTRAIVEDPDGNRVELLQEIKGTRK